MLDITKCSGDECHKKLFCWRFTSKPDYLQSYFTTPPIEYNGNCEYYLEDNFTNRDMDPFQDTWRDK